VPRPAQLRRRQAEAEAVLGGIAEGVFAVDRERRITWLNPRAAALAGVAPDEAVGRFCGDVLDPVLVDGVRPCEERCPILEARFRGRVRATERLHGRRGLETTVVITSAPPDRGPPGDAGESVQFQIVRDETEEEVVRRLRDAVIANVSHEFRTPLAAQLASIEMLRDRLQELGRAELDELLRSVERPALRLTRLIDNLLESLRIDSGRDTIRRRSVALDQIVEESVELTASLIQQKQQQLEIDLPWPLPPIAGDAPRLVQVFVNLLANAHKFAPAGSTIRIRGAVEAEELSVWVEDDGPGFPEEAGDRLFERFRRAPGEEPQESGMGLGLWIVHSIVTRHGGRVLARNTGTGARVTVVLPRGGGDEDPGR
jgi:signal transduction histidine kinase